jgi:hypothetical protein
VVLGQRREGKTVTKMGRVRDNQTSADLVQQRNQQIAEEKAARRRASQQAHATKLAQRLQLQQERDPQEAARRQAIADEIREIALVVYPPDSNKPPKHPNRAERERLRRIEDERLNCFGTIERFRARINRRMRVSDFLSPTVRAAVESAAKELSEYQPPASCADELAAELAELRSVAAYAVEFFKKCNPEIPSPEPDEATIQCVFTIITNSAGLLNKRQPVKKDERNHASKKSLFQMTVATFCKKTGLSQTKQSRETNADSRQDQ